MIESVNNEKIKEYAKLKLKKYRDEMGMFIVEGEHLVEEAIKVCDIVDIFSLDGRDGTTKVTDNVMAKLSELKSVPSVLAVLKKRDNGLSDGNILVLDGIQNPGNLGTIIRSAIAFGVDNIVLSLDTVDEYNTKVLRASEGMLFHINVMRTNLEEFLSNLSSDYMVLTTDVATGVDIKDVDIEKKYVLIMGNEGNGVRDNIKAWAHSQVYIAMNKACESLNVGVATSILLYELNGKIR